MSLIGKEISGSDFNKIYKGTNFYKFLNNNLTHCNVEYKLGLNIDILEFNPTKSCSNGGLYFCEGSKNYLYWNNYGQKLAYIEIPDDARVYVEEDKFKADKIILKEILNFEDVPDSIWINVLQKKYIVLQYVKEQTDELCKIAVQQNGRALQFVKKQTEDICKLAVKNHWVALKYVNEQTYEICRLAIEQNSLALEYVDEQNEELCKLAVQLDGNALEYVKEQTEEICKMAILQNNNAVCYLKEQFRTNEILKLAGL